MNELIFITMNGQDNELEKFDFGSPEDVIIEVIAKDEFADQSVPDWNKHFIDSAMVLRGVEGITGAASYEQSYGGFLDYTIKGMIDCPGEGWWIVVGVTGHYHKGDGWMTDDDMDFYFQSVRKATPSEIQEAI